MDRRSFFNFGRAGVLPSNLWEAFCHRIQRTIRGKFKVFPNDGTHFNCAEIYLERLEDVQHLYAYCCEYDVGIALGGFASTESVIARDLLMVYFGTQVNKIEFLGNNACLVAPGVKVGSLSMMGYKQFDRVPAGLTVAQWFANPAYHDCRPGFSFLSGVERAQVLFADGSQAVLAGFGVDDKQALTVPILNQTIPQLFELLANPEVVAQLQNDYWPYAYRLDSLQKKLVDINLARVFQGHQGKLVWVQQMVIRKIPEDVLLLPKDADFIIDAALQASVNSINARVKNLFDANAVFLYDDEVNISIK